MSTALAIEVLPLPVAPEQSFLNRIRTAAGVIVHAATSWPELSAMNADPFTLAGGIAYAEKQEIPPEDPEAVKARDGVEPDAVTPRGGDWHAPSPDGRSDAKSSGRKSPSGSDAVDDGSKRKKK